MKFYSYSEFIVFLEAYLLLHFSKFLIIFIPFKKIASRLGKLNCESPNTFVDKAVWLPVEIAITRASRFTFHKSKCYDQALAAKMMLKRRGIPSTLYFGLLKSEHGLSAHAWVIAGQRVITGSKMMHLYTPVAWFGDYFGTNMPKS